MKTLLITGLSGFLGGHLGVIALAQGWQVVGTRHTAPELLNQPDSLAVDLRDRAAVAQLFERVQPDAVIHAAAMSKANQCEQSPAAAQAINVTATVQIGALCRDRQIPLVFTSTDLVFDGTQAPYAASAPPTPLNTYGRQKAEAEAQLLEQYPQAAIARLPLLFGVRTATAGCFLQDFMAKLQAGTPLALFTDEFRTPVSATTAAQGLLLLLDRQVAGIWHLGGRERLSRYAFGQRLVAAWQTAGLDPAIALTWQRLLHPVTQAEVDLVAPRPADVSLDSTPAFNLGYDPSAIAAELEAIAHQELG